MPPLQGTFSLAEMNDVSVAVGKNLDLNMSRMFEILLDVERSVTESRYGLPLCRFVDTLKLACFMSDSHSLAATAGRGFQKNRKAMLFGKLLCFDLRMNGAVAAGNNRHTRLRHQVTSSSFRTHRRNGFCRWTDPN